MERYPTQEIDMTSYTYADASYPTAHEATAAALYDYCTACGSHEGGAEEMLHTMSLSDIVNAAQADGWTLTYWQEAHEGRTLEALRERITE